MKLELQKDGWLGKVLGVGDHPLPTNICSLGWGITWRAVLAFIGGLMVLGFLWLLALGNYYLIISIFTDSIVPKDAASTGFLMDIIALIAGWAIISTFWSDIRPYVEKWTSKCPKVEWK